jgi:hypothetical protein
MLDDQATQQVVEYRALDTRPLSDTFFGKDATGALNELVVGFMRACAVTLGSHRNLLL